MAHSAVRKLKAVSGLLCACLWLVHMGQVQAAPLETDPESHTGRVSDIQGSLALRGEAEDDISYAERNTVLRPYDTLWTPENSYGEIELENGSWLRLSSNTKVEARQLPPGGEFRLWAGSVYVQTATASEWPIRLNTPAGEVEIYGGSVVRVDLIAVPVDEADPVGAPPVVQPPVVEPPVIPVADNEELNAPAEESVRVTVYSGRAQVFPDTGPSVRLYARELVCFKAEQAAQTPIPFDVGDIDGFDKYHQTRVAYYAARPVAPELGANVVGARDLNGYGTWTTVERVRYWRPHCSSSWRPYSYGYWSYLPRWGYTWVDYAPWGYATCHYGRWIYLPRYGWLWRPGYQWRPAHVYWSTYHGYYGWAPLDPWGRPCHYGRGGFYSSRFFIDLRSWTFCPRDRFYYNRHHRRYAAHEHILLAGSQLPRLHGQTHAVRDFHVVRDVHRELGIPRERVRGIMRAADGVPARERVRRLEEQMPEIRLRLIEARFQTPIIRDRERLHHVSNAERLQENRALPGQAAHILRGNEAVRTLTQQRAWQQRAGVKPSLSPTHVVAQKPREAKQPEHRNPVVRPRVDAGEGDRPGAAIKNDGRGISRNLPVSIKAVTPDRDMIWRLNPQRSLQVPGATSGLVLPDNSLAAKVNDRTERHESAGKVHRPDAPRANSEQQEHAVQSSTKPKQNDVSPALEVRKDEPQHNKTQQPGAQQPGAQQPGAQQPGAQQPVAKAPENERRAAPRREAELREAQQREAQQREAEERRAQRREAEQHEAERAAQAQADAQVQAEARRQAAERRAIQQRAAEQREAQQREAQKREAEKRAEAQQREAQEREEAQQREAEARAAERREARRREAEQREAEQKDATRAEPGTDDRRGRNREPGGRRR